MIANYFQRKVLVRTGNEKGCLSHSPTWHQSGVHECRFAALILSWYLHPVIHAPITLTCQNAYLTRLGFSPLDLHDLGLSSADSDLVSKSGRLPDPHPSPRLPRSHLHCLNSCSLVQSGDEAGTALTV